MAMFLTAFNIEIFIDEDSRIQPDLKYFMFGMMHPEGRIPLGFGKGVSNDGHIKIYDCFFTAQERDSGGKEAEWIQSLEA